MKAVLELVKGKVNFEYRSGYTHYSTLVGPDFIFPVPISDTGEATFKIHLVSNHFSFSL